MSREEEDRKMQRPAKEKSDRQRALEECLRRIILRLFRALIAPKEKESDLGGSAGSKRRNMVRRLIRRLLFIIFAIMILIFGLCHLLSDELEVTFYHLYSSKMTGAENARIVVLADLHNRGFGDGSADLIAKIAVLKPDLIIMAGDMVDLELLYLTAPLLVPAVWERGGMSFSWYL